MKMMAGAFFSASSNAFRRLDSLSPAQQAPSRVWHAWRRPQTGRWRFRLLPASPVFSYQSLRPNLLKYVGPAGCTPYPTLSKACRVLELLPGAAKYQATQKTRSVQGFGFKASTCDNSCSNTVCAQRACRTSQLAHDLRAIDEEEECSRFIGHRARNQRLACAAHAKGWQTIHLSRLTASRQQPLLLSYKQEQLQIPTKPTSCEFKRTPLSTDTNTQVRPHFCLQASFETDVHEQLFTVFVEAQN